jgi:hypothetical protein
MFRCCNQCRDKPRLVVHFTGRVACPACGAVFMRNYQGKWVVEGRTALPEGSSDAQFGSKRPPSRPEKGVPRVPKTPVAPADHSKRTMMGSKRPGAGLLGEKFRDVQHLID